MIYRLYVFKMYNPRAQIFSNLATYYFSE